MLPPCALSPAVPITRERNKNNKFIVLMLLYSITAKSPLGYNLFIYKSKRNHARYNISIRPTHTRVLANCHICIVGTLDRDS